MKPFEQILDEEMRQKMNRKNNVFNGSSTTELLFKRFDKDLPALFKEDEGNAGFDLFARLDQPITLKPGEVATFPLNVATKLPTLAVGLLFQRSSTFRKWGVRLTNGVGVIDSIFSGSDDEYGAEFQNVTNEPITINYGDKVCQVVFVPLFPFNLKEVEQLDQVNRGGFGTSFDSADHLKMTGVLENEVK